MGHCFEAGDTKTESRMRLRFVSLGLKEKAGEPVQRVHAWVAMHDRIVVVAKNSISPVTKVIHCGPNLRRDDVITDDVINLVEDCQGGGHFDVGILFTRDVRQLVRIEMASGQENLCPRKGRSVGVTGIVPLRCFDWLMDHLAGQRDRRQAICVFNMAVANLSQGPQLLVVHGFLLLLSVLEACI